MTLKVNFRTYGNSKAMEFFSQSYNCYIKILKILTSDLRLSVNRICFPEIYKEVHWFECYRSVLCSDIIGSEASGSENYFSNHPDLR